jgi:hypothetical protein
VGVGVGLGAAEVLGRLGDGLGDLWPGDADVEVFPAAGEVESALVAAAVSVVVLVGFGDFVAVGLFFAR